jgi:cold shock CspA family protein
MMEGEVQHLNTEKKYGFIKCAKFLNGVFFHLKDYNGDFDQLSVGDNVSFDLVNTPKGSAAKNVEMRA